MKNYIKLRNAYCKLKSRKDCKISSSLPLKLWLINNTERTLDVDFSRFSGFLFTITPRHKPKGVTRIRRWITRHRERIYV